MRALAILLALATPAAAQDFFLSAVPQRFEMPRIVDILDKNGKLIVKAYVSRGRTVVRTAGGELVGTLAIEPDGSTQFYDPNGKRIVAPVQVPVD